MNHRMTRDQLYQWAADNSIVEPDSGGSPDQALMSGWINAMDMQDSGEINNDEDFIDIAYSEFDNMGYSI